ncbi:MAG: hypothetical protein IPM27_06230 [Nitrosomonadales bacterium]|jgi:hypothetical protein|nr:hypothetical protein [Nitrosomonadales bacterium]
MFEELTKSDLRSQIEQHLLMVEEVLGGMDSFIQQLEKRVSRIEEGLGLEPEGISASGWVADLQRVKAEVASIRSLVK